MKKLLLVAFTAVYMTGCATAGKDITAVYVSPNTYNNLDCQQLYAEQNRISRRVNELTGRLDEASDNDKYIAAAGALLFWPALFALGGDKEQEAQLARLKGEYEAVESQIITKKCGR